MHIETPTSRLVAVNTLLVAAIFIGDLVIPLGIAGGVLYVVVVLLAMWLPDRFVYLYATLCTGLTLVGFVASPEGGTLLTAIANRAVAIFSIWVVALLGLQRRRLHDIAIQHAQIIDQVQNAIIAIDMDGRVTDWNRGAEAMFGYGRSPMIGSPIERLYQSGEAEVLSNGVLEALLQEGSGELETESRKASGTAFWSRQWLLLRRDQHDAPSGIIIQVADITSRREADKAANKMERFYQQVLDELPLQVALFDEEGRFLYLNPASLSSEEMRRWIIGRTEMDYFERVGRNIDAARERDRYRRIALTDQKAVEYEEQFLTRTGESRAFLHGFSPVASEVGEVTRVLGYRYDITEHKRTAWALQESLARLQAILETAGDGIITVDEEGAIETFNRAAQRIFGYSFEEAADLGIDALLTDEPGGETESFRKKYLSRNGNSDGAPVREFAAIRKGGTVFPVEVAISELGLDEQRHFTVILRDLTARKRTEKEVRLYTERLEALRQLDEAILSAQSVKDVARVAVRHLLQMIPAGRAEVALFDPDHEAAMVLRIEPDGSVSGPRSVPLERFRSLYQTGKTENGSPCLRIPLRVQDSNIGAVCLFADGQGSFEPEHESIALEVGGPLAIAIQDARLFEEVDATTRRLRALSQRLVEVQEQERRNIARELHDEIGQSLTGLKLLLETVEADQGSSSVESVREARVTTQHLLSRVRDLSLDLRPAILDDFGLLSALLWLTDRYKKQTGVEVAFRHAGLDQRFESRVETAAFRVVQEALTNVARHSGVDRAIVRVIATSEALTVKVEDAGAGFVLHEAIDSGESSGLSGMQERVGLLGGELTIETGPNRGTTLTAEFPLVQQKV